MKAFFKNQKCRICKSTDLFKVLDFGKTPLANAFIKPEQISKQEHFFPLAVNFCQNCHLLQLTHTVSPRILFRDYVYVSSTSPVFIQHFIDYATQVKKMLNLPQKSLVIDIGSNDGILLAPFQKLGMRVLGIEPATGIAKIANKNGLETIAEFFSLSLVKKIIEKYGYASVICANNVFAHINDIDKVTAGVYELLSKNGVFVIEVPYLLDFLDKNLFDTVYHEHLSYYALHPLITFLNGFDMRIFFVERVSSHGGSIRVYICKANARYRLHHSVNNLQKLEQQAHLGKLSIYKKFAQRIEKNKQKLTFLLDKLKANGKSIAGYGAPAKGNTLLNYFHINRHTLDYIVDDSKYKQGLLTPGTHIPVVSSQKLKQDPPDYLLILAWNFANSIIEKNEQFKKAGGKFIIPIPEPKII